LALHLCRTKSKQACKEALLCSEIHHALLLQCAERTAPEKTRKALAFLVETTTNTAGTALTRDRDLPTLMGKQEAKGEKY